MHYKTFNNGRKNIFTLIIDKSFFISLFPPTKSLQTITINEVQLPKNQLICVKSFVMSITFHQRIRVVFRSVNTFPMKSLIGWGISIVYGDVCI